MTQCKFGMIDTETGLSYEGYIENGEMKFKKIPWYKKLFTHPPTQVEYIKSIMLTKRFIWSKHESQIPAALYKKFNPLTNKIQRVYAETNSGRVDFDVRAFEKDGLLIVVNP